MFSATERDRMLLCDSCNYLEFFYNKLPNISRSRLSSLLHLVWFLQPLTRWFPLSLNSSTEDRESMTDKVSTISRTFVYIYMLAFSTGPADSVFIDDSVFENGFLNDTTRRTVESEPRMPIRHHLDGMKKGFTWYVIAMRRCNWTPGSRGIGISLEDPRAIMNIQTRIMRFTQSWGASLEKSLPITYFEKSWGTRIRTDRRDHIVFPSLRSIWRIKKVPTGSLAKRTENKSIELYLAQRRPWKLASIKSNLAESAMTLERSIRTLMPCWL